MIFVTVGTHEQPFNRLIKAVDELKVQKHLSDEVFMQIGYSDYLPEACSYERFVPHPRMDELMCKADIVITHAGPGSIFHCLKYDKVPVVVPRQPGYSEHIDLHQVRFTKFLESKGTIIAVYDTQFIKNALEQYTRCRTPGRYPVNENLKYFTKRIDDICNGFFSNTDSAV